MLLNLPSSLYAAAATFRRQWYAGHRGRQRQLSRPVISVGNLRVGGSGKTPIVACLARELARRGERPAILSRGYARPIVTANDGRPMVTRSWRRSTPRVTRRCWTLWVFSHRLCGAVCAGLRGNSVARLFISLDDGFQHLWRVMSIAGRRQSDLEERPLPAGRLREPLTAARHATALLTTASAEGVERLRAALNITTLFQVSRRIGSPRPLSRDGACSTTDRVVAVAGIARPQRFFDDLTHAGWRVAETIAFPDHHQFTVADVVRVADAVRRVGARSVLTTEKDAVRLERLDLRAIPVAAVPLVAEIEPGFFDWLSARLASR